MKRFMFYLAALILLSFAVKADDFGKLFVQNGEPFVLDESKELFESPGLGWIFVDRNLDIYLPDYIAKNVKRYDKTGRLIMVYGKPGKGPGELECPVKVIVKNDLVIVSDFLNHNFSIFDRISGKFAKSVPNIQNDIGLMYGSDGSIYTIGTYQNETEMIRHMNDDMSVQYKFFKPEVLTKIVINTLPFVFMDFDAAGNIYVGVRTSCKIAVYDKNYKLIRVLGEPGRNWKQLPEKMDNAHPYFEITSKEKMEHTFLVDIYLLNNKYLLLMKSIINNKDAFHLDLYSTNGKKIYSDFLSERIIVGRDYAGNIYVYSTKETGDDVQRLLCRYRLRDDIR